MEGLYIYSYLFENLIFTITLTSLIVIVFYYFFFFINLSYYKSNIKDFNQPISIILCAKNEIENLKQNIPLLLAQKYFNFEIVVVNDQSSDNSLLYLESISKKYNNLNILNIDNFVNHSEGKKFALTLGIKTAKHDHLLLTDADCKPDSNEWVKKMSRNFNKSDIILGFGGYKKEQGLLNKIIRYDTFNVAQQYLSFSLRDHTYMGVGRNLAYKKSLFFDNKGFASHIHIPSGDDDLFIQEISKGKKVSIEIDTNSHTTSEVSNSLNEWVYQKRRHLSTSPMYKWKFKLLLSIYPISQLLFMFGIITLYAVNYDTKLILILIAVRFVSSYIINFNSMKQLNTYDLYWIHPIYEILNLLVQGNFVLLNMFKKPKKWSR